MQHFMKLAREPFVAIQEGRKVVESRLFDEKRKLISVGDEIVFSESEHPENTVCAEVILLRRYSFLRKFLPISIPAFSVACAVERNC